MDFESVQNTHFKLLASDFCSPTPSLSNSSSNSISFTRKGIRVSRVEVLGVVVTHDFKPEKFLRFSVDDGSGCIQCVLWLNQRTSPFFSRRRPSDVRLIAQMASVIISRIQIGVLVRVRGRVSGFRGLLQVTVEDAVAERDPNSEILHWLDCVRLARERYDVLAQK